MIVDGKRPIGKWNTVHGLNELVLIKLLRSGYDYWDEDGNITDYKLSTLHSHYYEAKGWLWTKHVMIPWYFRALRLWRALSQDDTFKKTHFIDIDKPMPHMPDAEWVDIDCDTCQFIIAEHLERWFDYYAEQHPEWEETLITREMIELTGITPTRQLKLNI